MPGETEEKSIAEEEKRIAEEEKRLAEETKKLEASILIPWVFIVSIAHFPGAEGFDFPSPFEQHIGFK